MLAAVSITPLGRPVVPPVPTSMIRSSAGPDRAVRLVPACGPGREGPASPASASIRPGTAGVGPSRQTRVVSLGRSGRILATSGPKAAWKIRHRQSKKSSRSRFSAASLRGLTGHHTAAAREMPNTQLNASGSLADKIATLSPAAIPERSSAAAICQDSCLDLAVGQGVPGHGQAGAPPARARRPCPGSRSAACPPPFGQATRSVRWSCPCHRRPAGPPGDEPGRVRGQEHHRVGHVGRPRPAAPAGSAPTTAPTAASVLSNRPMAATSLASWAPISVGTSPG